jgi:predicted nuclease of predicted toxin-antitoxin system
LQDSRFGPISGDHLSCSVRPVAVFVLITAAPSRRYSKYAGISRSNFLDRRQTWAAAPPLIDHRRSRLLLDHGLPRSAATLLQQTGWNVVHMSEIGMSRASDVDIMQRARAEARACVALDADFHCLLATRGERGPSVIRIRKEGRLINKISLTFQRHRSRAVVSAA